MQGDPGPVLPRFPRGLSRIAAFASVAGMTFVTLLRTAAGLVPLAVAPLSPAGPRPALTPATSLAFRVLVLWRWLWRRNDVGRGLAALYLRRAAVETPTARSGAPQPVETVESEDLAEVLADWTRRPRPVVLRGHHVPKRDWSPGALVDEFGETQLLFNERQGFGLRPLRRLLDPQGGPAYVANCERLLVEHPELLEALDLESWRPRLGLHPYCVQLFLGTQLHTGLTFHCANNVNLFVMLHGRKRWTFVDPAFSYFMYPWVTSEAAYVASVVHHREIDPEHFALYDSAPKQEVVLEPGDVLLNPPWWWHQVENLDADTVGCATRWTGLRAPETNRLFSFAQALSPRAWRTTAGTLVDLFETGGDLRELYRRQAGSPTTRIERASHTAEQYEPGAFGRRSWPAPARSR